MAKAPNWLQGATGKLRGFTLYKDKGSSDTIIRDVVTPSNPKTTSQTVQRAVMKTIVKAYAFMKEIVDHSFEGQEYGRKSMSFFNQQNAILSRQKIADMQNEGLTFYQMFNFMPKVGPQFLPNQYCISMGSLPQLFYSVTDEHDWARLNVGHPENQIYTYQEICDLLNLRRGDQLTFVIITDITQTNMSPAFDFHYARVILDPVDPATKLQAPMSTPFFQAGQNGYNAINFPSPRNQASGRMLFHQGQETIDFQKSMNNTVVACGVIVSRKDGNKWMRSTQYLAYNGGNYAPYSLGNAMDSFAENAATQIYATNPYYLDNAGEGGGNAAATGANNQAGTGTGGNNEQAEAPHITLASAGDGAGNSVNLVAGSTKIITYNADFQTKNITIEVQGNYPNSAVISLRDSAGAVIQGGGPEHFVEGQAQIDEVALTKDATYQLYVGEEATGMKLKLTYTAPGGGGDNGLLNEG